MLTLAQKAWQLHENGVSFGELATFANLFDKSMDEAIEATWQCKLNGKHTHPQTGEVIDQLQ